MAAILPGSAVVKFKIQCNVISIGNRPKENLRLVTFHSDRKKRQQFICRKFGLFPSQLAFNLGDIFHRQVTL